MGWKCRNCNEVMLSTEPCYKCYKSLGERKMITHKKMSLFDAPAGAVICHAVNAQGVWGSGIAREFKEIYPGAFTEYNKWCEKNGPGNSGYWGWANWPNEIVGWLCTSENYGNRVDHPEVIKVNTTLALIDFCNRMYSMYPRPNWETIDIYSNKFNSGLFNVPWKDSELILETVLKKFPRINWIVCSND